MAQLQTSSSTATAPIARPATKHAAKHGGSFDEALSAVPDKVTGSVADEGETRVRPPRKGSGKHDGAADDPAAADPLPPAFNSVVLTAPIPASPQMPAAPQIGSGQLTAQTGSDDQQAATFSVPQALPPVVMAADGLLGASKPGALIDPGKAAGDPGKAPGAKPTQDGAATPKDAGTKPSSDEGSQAVAATSTADTASLALVQLGSQIQGGALQALQGVGTTGQGSGEQAARSAVETISAGPASVTASSVTGAQAGALQSLQEVRSGTQKADADRRAPDRGLSAGSMNATPEMMVQPGAGQVAQARAATEKTAGVAPADDSPKPTNLEAAQATIQQHAAAAANARADSVQVSLVRPASEFLNAAAPLLTAQAVEGSSRASDADDGGGTSDEGSAFSSGQFAAALSQGPAAPRPAAAETPAAAAITSSAPTQPMMPASFQLATGMVRAAKDGIERIEIRLRPEALGAVDVSLQLGSDGSVTASVKAERAETLQMLAADAPQLEQTLRDTGLKAESGCLNFSMRGDADTQGGQQGQGRSTPGGGHGSRPIGGAEASSTTGRFTASAFNAASRQGSSGIDIHA